MKKQGCPIKEYLEKLKKADYAKGKGHVLMDPANRPYRDINLNSSNKHIYHNLETEIDDDKAIDPHVDDVDGNVVELICFAKDGNALNNHQHRNQCETESDGEIENDGELVDGPVILSL